MALVFPAPAQIKNLLDPTDTGDAATKYYVDYTVTHPSGDVTIANLIVTNSANLGNAAVANYFIGSGANLTNLAGANVTGQVSNALVAGTVYTAAQPNITSVGTLSSLSVSGDTTVTGNLTVTGTTLYANIATLNIKDPVIEQGGNPNGSPLTSNDGVDRGQLLHYYVAGITNAPVDAFMGWKNSSNEFVFASNATLLNNTVTVNQYGNIHVGYIIGNGSSLTSLTGANVTGAVAYATTANSVAGSNVSGQVANALVAGTVYTAAQPNITSVGTLTSLTISNAGQTGNITADNANLGNSVTANYFIGSGNNLSNIQASNITGTVANANYAAYAGNVTIAAQSNITSLGTLSNLTSNGTVNFTNTTNISLGSIANLHISGGTADYYLQTDGAGNISWAAQTGTSSIIVDSFTGDGSTSTFTLSATPANINVTSVNYNGASLLRDSYSLSGSSIIFAGAPATGSKIEVTTTVPVLGGTTGASKARVMGYNLVFGG